MGAPSVFYCDFRVGAMTKRYTCVLNRIEYNALGKGGDGRSRQIENGGKDEQEIVTSQVLGAAWTRRSKHRAGCLRAKPDADSDAGEHEHG